MYLRNLSAPPAEHLQKRVEAPHLHVGAAFVRLIRRGQMSKDSRDLKVGQPHTAQYRVGLGLCRHKTDAVHTGVDLDVNKGLAPQLARPLIELPHRIFPIHGEGNPMLDCHIISSFRHIAQNQDLLVRNLFPKLHGLAQNRHGKRIRAQAVHQDTCLHAAQAVALGLQNGADLYAVAHCPADLHKIVGQFFLINLNPCILYHSHDNLLL